jgi:hypothetical protein
VVPFGGIQNIAVEGPTCGLSSRWQYSPDDAKDQHDEVYGDRHEGKFSHELLAGGAGFAAMKYFEDQQRRKGEWWTGEVLGRGEQSTFAEGLLIGGDVIGETVNHSFAKELLAGFASAEVDKLVESKGLDYIDREKTKHHAKKQAEHLYDEQYGNQDYYDP